MKDSVELDQPSPDMFVWHRYEPAVKAELFSTGLITSAGSFLFDPIQIVWSRLERAAGPMGIAGVIVTNVNHSRAAIECSRAFGVPLFSDRESFGSLDPAPVVDVNQLPEKAPEFSIVPIPGAPAGEIAVHCSLHGGTLVIGDALINFGSNGFTYLPAKYCRNARQMRSSLRRLLEFSFERIAFAHGSPIFTNARERLEQVLSGNTIE